MTIFVTMAGKGMEYLLKESLFANMNREKAMFNNCFNIHDLDRLREKFSRGEWRQVLTKLFANARGRTLEAWKQVRNPPLHAWDIPAVRARWNVLVSGTVDTDHVAYICGKYLSNKNDLIALSPGCGGGGNELRWAETGRFAKIDAFDLSPQRIANAEENARQKGLAAFVRFQVGDVQKISGQDQYDLIMAEGALHHFYPLRPALQKLKMLLKPGGLLIVNDFVGPPRLQWTARQLLAANAMLTLIPVAYRRRWPDGRIKKIIDAPGRLRMRLADPSEAAESSLIMPLLREMFTTLEIKNKGGTIVNLVFFQIAHHYLQADETADQILRLCFALEDILMRNGDISSDYILGVFQKTTA
jgi:SAM-dependent methyltransferase